MQLNELEERCIYHEENDQYYLDLYSTKDNVSQILIFQEYCIVVSNDRDSNECMALDRSGKIVKRFMERTSNVQYYIEHFKTDFLILYKSSKHQFTLYKLSHNAAATSDFVLSRGEKLIVFGTDEHVVDLEIFRNYIAVFMKRNSFSELKFYDMIHNTAHTVNLPNQFCSIQSGNNFVSFKSYYYYAHGCFDNSRFVQAIIALFSFAPAHCL